MKRNSKGTVSVILVLALIALVGFFTINSIMLKKQITELSERVSKISAENSQVCEDNSELERALNSENESEYIEKYARDELDYVAPGERVYADSAN